jgi:DNA-binding CsgD family transcriptional regulator
MTNRSTDEAAILGLLERMRRAARAGEYEGHAEGYVQADYSMRWHASPLGGTLVLKGWEEIDARLKESAARRIRNPLPAHDPSIIENVIVRVSGDMAWAAYTRRYPDRPGHRASPEPAHHFHLLERQDGAWKLAIFCFLEPDRGRPGAARIRVDADGAILWIDEAAKAALADDDDLVVRAGRLRLRDHRANQQLAAALRWAEGLTHGLSPGRGAVPVVIDRGEGLPVKVLWVVSDSGAILLSLGDAQEDERRLDAAAVVYGLSPAQRQVAGHIVDGLALPDIARTMKVRLTTVRTHLNRMFEKTGVRNQTALVRALLSAATPL